MGTVTDPTDLGVLEVADAIRRGALTATDALEATLARIAATDGELLAWTTVDAKGARAAARACDEALLSGRPAGPLHGVPIGIKDLIDVAGLPTTAGAPPFAHSAPTRDATLVARLRAAGAVIVGKTDLTQFASKDPAPTRNPWNLDHTPGGSSSGSAAAVAARQVPAAIGTQTVGSILRPSAFCGVVGLKGAFGDVPMDGILPLARSLDHAGPMTRSVADAALVESVLAGRRIDVSTLHAPRLAVAPELLELAEPELREHLGDVLRVLEGAGAALLEAPLPASVSDVVAASWIVLEAEAAAQHASWFAEHEAEYAPKIAELVRAGLGHSSADLGRALGACVAFREAVSPWLDGFDALLSPVAPGPAPRRDEGTGDPTLCAPWSSAGLPSIAIPSGIDDAGMPLAIQLAAGVGGLERLLGAAGWCERVIAFDARPGLPA